MASTANLFHEDFKTARSGYRQAGNVDKLSELNHLLSPHVKRPPHARDTGEGRASVSPRFYCGKISERAKRALERRLRPHDAFGWPTRSGSAKARSGASYAVARASHLAVLQPLADFFGVIPARGFRRPQRSFDPRDARRVEALW